MKKTKLELSPILQRLKLFLIEIEYPYQLQQLAQITILENTLSWFKSLNVALSSVLPLTLMYIILIQQVLA